MAGTTYGKKSQGWLREGSAAPASHPVEKTPQFRASLDRLTDRAGDQLTQRFGPLFTSAREGLRNESTFAVLGEHVGHPAAVAFSVALDARLAIIVETSAVEFIIAAMFGLDAAEAVPEEEMRERTSLEVRLVGELASALAGALCDAFAPVANFDLGVEDMEVLEDQSLLGPKDSLAVAARFTIKAPTGAFGVTLLIPHAFMTPLGEAFAKGPAPGAAKLDPAWTRRMERRVTEADLTLTAILDEFQMTLSDLSSLKVGHQLPLSDTGQGRVRIECGERGVFVCSLGEQNGRYALQVEDIIAMPIEAAYPPAP